VARRKPPTPTPTTPLAIIYAKAENAVIAAAKRRKGGEKDAALLAKFKGAFPPSLLKVMAGESHAGGVGFHQIALQIGITSNALGKREEDVIAACEGLIERHQSDGTRYNSPGKRREELKRMLRYTQDNVCYTYSKDAVRRLLPPEASTPDLDGITDGSVASGGDREILEGTFLTREGMFLTRNGIFLTREGMFQRPDTNEDILDFVWVSPTEIISPNNPTQFRFRGDPTEMGTFRSDLMKAPVLGTTALA
jgi:hypothetical protein